MKLKTCRVCRCKFAPAQPMAVVCSIECAKSLAESKRLKAQKKAQLQERRVDNEKRKAQRKMPQLTAIAQKAFNGYIRARDAGKPCISCSVPLPSEGVGGAYDCGHYRSVGSAPHLRFGGFAEDNAHGQCKHCNLHLAGNHVAYRAGLISRIGLQRVEALEADQTLRKYSREGLIELAAHYRAETRKLKGTL